MDFEVFEKLRGKLDHFQKLPFRKGQVEGIEFIMQSERMIKILCAPTGSGKSLIGIMIGMANIRFCYLCSSKQLQKQIEEEFPEVKVMWGRNNFPCTAFTDIMADDCPYASIDTSYDEVLRRKVQGCKSQCPYEMRKKEVRQHPYQVLNYSYFLHECNFVGSFPQDPDDPDNYGYPVIICDEADTIESQLSSFILLSLSKSVLERLKVPVPGRKTAGAKDSLEVWKQWADNTEGLVSGRRNHVKNMMETLNPDHADFKKWSRELKTLETLIFKLNVFTNSMDKTWLYDEVKDLQGNIKQWEFKPTYLSPELVEQFFLRHGKSFVFMSATFPPAKILAKVLGLDVGSIDYAELPSEFPVENRQVILRPVADLSYKTFKQDVGKAIDEIKNILAEHPNERGLIHTVSYKLNKLVMEGVNDPRLITHISAEDKMEVLDRFLNSDKPLVFVSPSSTRGLDLPDDLCRFVIICKAPFQSLADKLVNARVYGSQVGNLWYRSDMCQEIIQGCGRAVRSKDDWAVVYILDRQAVNVILKHQKLFPRYWMEAVEIF